MTAAEERATEQDLGGAAEARGEQALAFWEAGVLPKTDIPSWLMPHLAEGGTDTCGVRSPEDDPWFCTRPLGHSGRHIASGAVRLYAAWPGTHAPVEADLTDPEPAPDLARLVEAAGIVEQLRAGAR